MFKSKGKGKAEKIANGLAIIISGEKPEKRKGKEESPAEEAAEAPATGKECPHCGKEMK